MPNILPSEIRYIISIFGIILGFLAFYPYIRDTLQKKIKPHAFSWLIWAILAGSAFVIQLLGNGGFGSFVTGISALMATIMSVLWFIYGDRKYHTIDFVSLIAATIAFFLWWYNKNPFYSIIIISTINLVWFVPTIRKSYKDPFSESLATWNLIVLRAILGIMALDIFTFDTIFFAWTNLMEIILLVFMILWRRNSLRKL